MEDKNIIADDDKAGEALTPAELIKKHNADPNHIISDSEMNNLKIGDTAIDEESRNEAIEKKIAEDVVQGKDKMNPYDILDT